MKRIAVLLVALLIVMGVTAVIYIIRSRSGDNVSMGALYVPVEIYDEHSEDGQIISKDNNEEDVNITDITGASKGAELMGIFETKEEAREAAKLYEIELIRYEQRVAVFSIKEGEDPLKIISKGKENGWPELSVNSINVLY